MSSKTTLIQIYEIEDRTRTLSRREVEVVAVAPNGKSVANMLEKSRNSAML